MCTYLTERAEVTGSGKGKDGWFTLSHATVYYDHPQHAPVEHACNIDFSNDAAGPGARVAVELSVDSARALVKAINATLDAIPSGMT